MADDDAPVSAAVADASASAANATMTTRSRSTTRSKKRSCVPSSLSTNPYSKQYDIDTINRRYKNSTAHSPFKQPTPCRPSNNNTAMVEGGAAVCTLSFKDDDGAEDNASNNDDGGDGGDDGDDDNNKGGGVFRDDSSSSSSSSVSYGSVEDDIAAWNNDLFTQPFDNGGDHTPTTAHNDGSSIPQCPPMHPSAGADKNYTPHYVEVPQECRNIIESSLREDWGIDTPHEFQVQSIYRGAFFDDVYLHDWAKTGYGKSVIPLCIASLRRGVAVIQEPLIGLGTDQVAKAIIVDRNIEAYHVDEHKFADAKLLKDRLNSMSEYERNNLSIILFLSPQALRKETEWTRLLTSLAAKDFISVLCVDEAHSVNIYESFRPEFKESILTLKHIYEACNKKPTRIAMSATMRVEDQQRIDELWGATPDFIVWTEMNRRRIFIDIVASGNPTTTYVSSIKHDYRHDKHKHDPDKSLQCIWYTNSKKKAEESLCPNAENILDQFGVDGESMACTGDSGIMQKSFIIAAFRGEKDLFTRPEREELADLEMDDEMCDLPNLKILAATEAANCGISSKKCRRGFRSGHCANLYIFVQEMGRVDRDGSLPPGA